LEVRARGSAAANVCGLGFSGSFLSFGEYAADSR
jgi:hypothetical protein